MWMTTGITLQVGYHESIVVKIGNTSPFSISKGWLAVRKKMKSSGWMFTDAVEWVGCLRCWSSPGSECRTPSGRKVHVPHGERIEALQQHPKFRKENYEHSFDNIWEGGGTVTHPAVTR